MAHTLEDANRLRELMQAAPEKDANQRRMDKQAIVAEVLDGIEAMQKRGYTCPPKAQRGPRARRSASHRPPWYEAEAARRCRFSQPDPRRYRPCPSVKRGRAPSRSAWTSGSRQRRRTSYGR